MPDSDKENQSKQGEEAAQRDALGNEIEASAPPLKPGKNAENDTLDEVGEDVAEAEEPNAVPPDLVSTPKSTDGSDAAEAKELDEPRSDDEDTLFDDDKTDQVIDDIVAKEGDDTLAAQDAAVAQGAVEPAREKRGWWRNKWLRWALLLVVFGGIVAAAAVPTARYWVLDTVGVRSSSSVTVVDGTTQLPLKGVGVSLAGQKTQTDSDGNAVFTRLRLGPAQLVIARVGFGEIKRQIVIGWGSNPLGRVALQATGVQYTIVVKDYLSGQPLQGVDATAGDAAAVSAKDGKIVLTVDNTAAAPSSATLSKDGYRSATISLNEDPTKPTDAALVIARKAVFVSKQSGKYDVYKSDLDGKNAEVLLAATGNENSNISLSLSQDGTRAAYVSTRDNKRDSGGFLLSSLVLIDTDTGSTLTIAEAAQIQLIDWIGSRLIFQLGSSDSTDKSRYTVVSYDYTNNTRVQLAAARQLQAVLSARGLVYYAPAADSSDPSIQLGLFRIGPDGKDKQQVVNTELSSVLRAAYGTLNLQATDGTWLSYDLASGTKTQIGTPASLASRLYNDNDGRTKSLWVNQGVLEVYDVASGKDTAAATLSGLVYPVEWAGASAVIFRVSNASETADYAASLTGGTPHKIADVAPTYGFSQAQ